jgi:hypothetical protein
VVRASPAWSPRDGHVRGDVADQDSPVAPMQRGRWCEHEDGEGKSPGKKDGSAAHQGGQALMRWWMGRRDDVSSRAVALW